MCAAKGFKWLGNNTLRLRKRKANLLNTLVRYNSLELPHVACVLPLIDVYD